ncbi:MAG: hypothetical protein H7Y07_01625 [Pyrinomonadaceae bacterium]|nr:hypothetical protein [Sphingobacteriaceae bacterium]
MKHLFLVLIFFFCTSFGFAQHPDSLKQYRLQYLAKQLGVSMDKAKQVASIQEQYKQDFKILLSKQNLKGAQSEQFQNLVLNKYKRLSVVLTTSQLTKLLSKTELQQVDPIYRKQFELSQNELKNRRIAQIDSSDKNSLEAKSSLVFRKYAQLINQTDKDPSLTVIERNKKIKTLIEARNQSIAAIISKHPETVPQSTAK